MKLNNLNIDRLIYLASILIYSSCIPQPTKSCTGHSGDIDVLSNCLVEGKIDVSNIEIDINDLKGTYIYMENYFNLENQYELLSSISYRNKQSSIYKNLNNNNISIYIRNENDTIAPYVLTFNSEVRAVNYVGIDVINNAVCLAVEYGNHCSKIDIRLDSYMVTHYDF